MTRPWTPDEKLPSGGTRLRTKRCCENCGRAIGDVTGEEMAAAINGQPLPSVADECGCVEIVEQLALFMNARDERESGTAGWPSLDIVARNSYLKDAAAILRAVVALGYGPIAPLRAQIDAAAS